MDLVSTSVRPSGRIAPVAVLRLLAETVVAVQNTLGTGDGQDNLALDGLERSVWLELAVACPDRAERGHLIERAKGMVAPPGAVSCRRAARLLVQAGGVLLCEAGQHSGVARERLEGCARRCADGAVRLERIALEIGGV